MDEKLALRPVGPGEAHDAGENHVIVNTLRCAREFLTSPHVHDTLLEPKPIAPPLNAAEALVARGLELRMLWMRGTDPEGHGALRKQISRAVDAETLAWLTQAWTTRARRLLRPGSLCPNFDLVAGFAAPMVQDDFFTLFGIPDGKRKRLLIHFAAMRRLIDGPAMEGTAHFFAMAASATIIEEVFRRPLPEDAISARTLLLAVDEGALQFDEAVAHAIMLLMGNQSSFDTLAALIARLSERPDIWAEMRAGTISVESVVEEELRLGVTTRVSLARITRQEMAFEEATIPAGTRIVFPLGEINRDPAVFSRPEEFDPARRGPRHLAFGAGRYMCLGMHLARANLRIALQALVDAIDVWPTVEATYSTDRFGETGVARLTVV